MGLGIGLCGRPGRLISPLLADRASVIVNVSRRTFILVGTAGSWWIGLSRKRK
jgi:hypothetical protein